jgi:hypothetical protein
MTMEKGRNVLSSGGSNKKMTLADTTSNKTPTGSSSFLLVKETKHYNMLG